MNSDLPRRRFLKASALALTAFSYGRVMGANERLRIGIIGCGSRGRDVHMPGVNAHAKTMNLEIVAVSDPHRLAREEAVAKTKEWYGREAKQFVSHRDLLAMPELDAVTVASPDHHHARQLTDIAAAAKDVYIEKPLAMTMDELLKAVDAAKAAKIVVQNGTQLRSMSTFTGCRELYASGVLGKVARIEQCRNGERPYWYGYLKDIKEADVDWKEFQGHRPERPFTPARYSAWYGYRDYTDGPVTNLGCHFLDLVHYITGATCPRSCVCMGGTYTWKDDYGFDCTDQVEAVWEYPEGFLVHYSTNFGNGSGSTFKIFGDAGVLDMVNWSAPVLTAEGGTKNRGSIKGKQSVKEIERPDHFLDWLKCVRERGTPNAPLEAGFQHAVAGLMAVRSMDSGKRTTYDPEKRKIKEG
ncbi:MAG: Gfo/Idh/MocA family oxidoreductase [Planctomycetota bacterium]|nr:Gfo/Idh/MocA family oxidoreductase [Planctomycetota bacterium]